MLLPVAEPGPVISRARSFEISRQNDKLPDYSMLGSCTMHVYIIFSHALCFPRAFAFLRLGSHYFVDAPFNPI